ncbi:MAG: bifunctional diaminohydroxyphosphoribosylaminopyrimidine deaminase/5-amino-6-(5-phosphoribosylamino)uracil reductase RibD [Selenomonadaceae bacterium]|nr:bifunctional diaminohydroxyphosphoribosylaminopyrimidine deaminase/5-amino-6-(5-phosphoribosylamino)uracil reductase RibD [Selenomonadaceae bacterium]
MTDEIFMREALNLAKNAEGRTTPNPLVGAVIVKDNRIISAGWHRKAGTPHAEVHALNMAGDLARGATMYVTLEPCSHFGRTPPCVDKIIFAGIARVVVATVDPNPKVSGRGIEILRKAGITVDVGILEDEARKINEVFFKWVTKNLPFVTMKFAMSLDGKISTVTGESQWISCEESRQFVHHLRDINAGIMVGVNTVLMDNPRLTTRIDGGKNPVRIIADSMARTPIDAKIICDDQAETIIAVTTNAPAGKLSALRDSGAEIIMAGDGEQVDLEILMRELAAREITSILLEGGGTLNFAMLEAGLVDKVFAFIAPKILGGKNAPTAVEGAGFKNLSDAFQLKNFSVEKIGTDILLVGEN